MNNDSTFTSPLIKSFQTDDKIENNTKKIRYHYTSPSAFLSIIENQRVHFTDIRYLNDKSEGIYLIKLIIEFFENHKNKYSYSSELFFNLIKEHSIEDLKNLNISKIKYIMPVPYMEQRHFVFCMSTKPDSLNMWNYYVNNGSYQGYNIGFSINKFLKTFDINVDKTIAPFTVYYGEVLYKESKQYKEISDFFDNLELKLKHNTDESKLSLRTIEIRNFIESKGAFFKNTAFESENEFRIVIGIADARVHRQKDHYAGENNKEIKDEFTTKNGLIIPFLSVKFDYDAINNITISPITEFEIAKDSIRELLNKKSSNKIEINKSNLPIRFW